MQHSPANGPIKNVVFDLGGVLVEWDPDGIISRLYANRQDQRTVKESVFLHEDWKELDRGTLEEEDAIASFSKRSGRPMEEIRTLMARTKESLDLLPGSLDLLDYLKGLGLSLFCLSNINAPTLAYLKDRYHFWDLFRGVMISGDLKLLKPEPEIYQRLLSQYELEPGETVLVDDQPSNVVGAEAVGMRGVWFTSPDDCRRQLERLIRGG